MFKIGESVTYEGLDGFINFVSEEYVTVCIKRYPSNGKYGETTVCLCVYPSYQDKIMRKETE